MCGKPLVCGELVIVPWRTDRPNVGTCHPGCAPKTGWRRIYHCSTACYWRQYRARRKEERTRKVICKSCGGAFLTTRRDARYCSGACRQDGYRLRKENAA